MSAVATAKVEVTPEMLAQALWQMGSDDQARFLVALADVIKADHANGNTSAYSLGELQWFFLGDELKRMRVKPAIQQIHGVVKALSHVSTLL